MNFSRSKIFNPVYSAPLFGFLAMSCVFDSTIDEIIVSADFRDSTLLQTQPASVTVIDAEAIAQRQARHLEQVLNLAPNVNFSSGASRGRFIQIRGIGERSQFIEPLNPSVGHWLMV